MKIKKPTKKKKKRKPSSYRKPEHQIKIAKARIEKLFDMAEKTFKTDPKLSDRYVKIARDISKKFKIRILSKFKRRFCKHCYKYLVPGKNLRVRMYKSHITYTCLECKKYWRMPVKTTKK